LEKQSRSKEKIDAFKQFVKEHPGLINKVKVDKQSWQDIFEEWVLLGENDEQWSVYKKKTVKQDQSLGTNKEKSTKTKRDVSIAQLMEMLKRVDINEVQHYISQFSGAMTGIQELLQQFQSSQNQSFPQRPTRPGAYNHPTNNNEFNPFFKD
jgi:hypothetical protein